MNRAAKAEELVDRVIGGASILLVGEAGVGKSHLAQDIAGHLERQGWGCETVFGTPSIQPLRFGAIQHLIADSANRTPAELIAMADGHLRRLNRGSGSLLVVDDLDGIDADSLAVVHQLAVRGHRVIATVRSNAAGSHLVLPFWKDAALDRVDITADPQATASLVEAFLKAPAAETLVDQIAALTLGNPLFIRELIADATATDRLVKLNGRYESVGRVTTAQRVTDLVETRFANLEPKLHDALELIAVCEPCPLTPLAGATDASLLDRLEALGLIVARSTDTREVVTVAHPLIGEVVRSSTPRLRRRKHQLVFSAAILDAVSQRSIDLARAVRWLVDAGEVPNPDHARAAARHYLSTFDGAAARAVLEAAALTSEPTVEVDLILGRALLFEGSIDEAVERFEHVLAATISDDERADAAVALSETLMFVRPDLERAERVCSDALESVTSVQARSRIVGSILLGTAMAGDFTPSLTLGVAMSDEPELDEPSLLSTLIITTLAQAMTGHTERFDADIKLAETLASRHSTAFPAALDQLLVTRAIDALAQGSISENQAELQSRLDDIGPHNAMSSILLQNMATTSFLQGRGSAARHFALTALPSGLADPLGLDGLAHAVAGRILAAVGEDEASHHASEQCLATPSTGIREAAFLGEAAALRLAMRGDVEAAAQACIDGHSQAGDNQVWSFGLLYQSVRFGAAAAVLSLMEAETQLHDTSICGAQIAHARALNTGSAEALRLVCERFATAGLPLYAAEAAAHASWHEHSDSLQSTRDAARAHTLFLRCDSLWSIALQQTDDPLTAREREICNRTATGQAAKTIAADLELSVRTVENHTQRAFKKLGLHNRSELEPIFA